jgi:hypothetical protein
MDLDAVADELYGLRLDDFISTRTARQRQAKDGGNQGLAEAIHRLPKPNAVAWLVNQLVRQHPGDIQKLLELGAGMRDATANLSGDLRELSRQPGPVIRGLVQQAEQLATATGRPISPTTARSLEETFYAALADPGAADAVAAGRLAVGLRPTGFAGLEGAAIHGPASAAKPPSRVEKRSRAGGERGGEPGEPRKRAKAKVAEAKSVAGNATRAGEEERARLQLAEQRVAEAADRVEQLRAELHEAVEAQSNAGKERRAARAGFDRADRAAQRAQQQLTDAEAELEHLGQ